MMGCSDILSPLKSLYLLSPPDGSRSIFLISDGFVGNKEDLFHLVAKHSVKNRLFCLGVGQVYFSKCLITTNLIKTILFVNPFLILSCMVLAIGFNKQQLDL